MVSYVHPRVLRQFVLMWLVAGRYLLKHERASLADAWWAWQYYQDLRAWLVQAGTRPGRLHPALLHQLFAMWGILKTPLLHGHLRQQARMAGIMARMDVKSHPQMMNYVKKVICKLWRTQAIDAGNIQELHKLRLHLTRVTTFPPLLKTAIPKPAPRALGPK